MEIKELAEQFFRIFRGLEDVHGVYSDLEADPTRQDGKLKGRVRDTVRSPITLDLWIRHLNGIAGLGVVPIRRDSTCSWGAIDIDVYAGMDHQALAANLRQHNLPLVVCRSKSGGAHLYCFATEPISAAKMVQKLREIAAFLGHGQTEIFPKQQKMDGTSSGSWINMPYFDGMKGSSRYCSTAEHEKLTPEEFITLIENSSKPPEWFDAPFVGTADLPEGPPCLSALVQIGFPEGTRNIGLYNLGVYARKASPDGYGRMIEEMNRKYLRPPLAGDEVTNVVRSVGKKQYGYQCSQNPLVSYCNAPLCRHKKFGVGMGTSLFPQCGQMTKIKTDPPIRVWELNGVKIEFEDEELQNQHKFQLKCMQHLNILIPTLKEAEYKAIVNKAMQDQDEREAPDDGTASVQFWDLVEKFCLGRVQAPTPDDVALGKPWTDKESGKTYFRSTDLKQYLQKYKLQIADNKVTKLLQDRGGRSESLMCYGKSRKVWVIPAFEAAAQHANIPAVVEKDQKPF